VLTLLTINNKGSVRNEQHFLLYVTGIMDWNMLYYPMNGQIVNAKGLMSIT